MGLAITQVHLAGSRRKVKHGRARERRDTSRRSSSAQRIIVSGPSVDIIVMQIVYKPAVTLSRHNTKAQKSDKIYSDEYCALSELTTINNNNK